MNKNKSHTVTYATGKYLSIVQREQQVIYAMKKAIELTKKADIRGVKVKIAGRLGGKEIARAESIKKGRLPLQTIRAKIDYCCYPIRTIYGVLGVKIWIFVDEE